MPEQDDAGFLPDIKTVTPQEQGAAVTKSLTDDQAKANFKKRLDELDINDPSESTPEPTPEPKPAEKPAAKVPPSVAGASEPAAFSPELLARAREHGITASEAKEYGTPALLERAVAHMDRSLSQRRPEPQRQPEPPPPEESLELPDLPAQDGEVEWDPKLQQWVQATRGAFDKLASENKQLKDHIAQTNQYLQRQEVERITQQWDGFFEKVPDEYKAAVGEGALADLENTAAGDLRKDVLRTFLALQQNYQQTGQRAPSFKTLADRALRAVATPAAVSDSKPKPADDDARIRDAQGRFLSAPTARRDSVNDNKLDGDTPPADPKKREVWAMHRFKRNAVRVFGEE